MFPLEAKRQRQIDYRRHLGNEDVCNQFTHFTWRHVTDGLFIQEWCVTSTDTSKQHVVLILVWSGLRDRFSINAATYRTAPVAYRAMFVTPPMYMSLEAAWMHRFFLLSSWLETC